MAKKQTFRKKHLQCIRSYTSFFDIIRHISKQSLIRLVVLFVCLGFILRSARYIGYAAKSIATSVGKKAAVVVSENFWKEMQKDLAGNINVLLIWFGWNTHAWWHLADTIILASFSPQTKSTTMISIPRDLYIYEKWVYQNRINAVYAYEYSNAQWDHDVAAKKLASKVWEIVWVEIPYYAIVDFNWFETLVNSIGGIDVDIPYTLYDPQYPDPTVWHYVTFSIDAWPQVLDGATALKYARSRHSTSDFSRSWRQQLIIKAILEKLRTSGMMTSPSSLQQLYEQYSKMVYTNIDAEEMIWLVKYAQTPPSIFSFGLTMECADMSYKTIVPWCLLYPWVRSDFGWMSVLLTRWSSGRNPAMYDYTQFFGFMVLQNPSYLVEWASINIYNWIDTAYARNFVYRNGIASKVAWKLKRYWFDVQEVENADENRELTLVTVPADKDYEDTLDMLALFLDFEVRYIDNPNTAIWPVDLNQSNTANTIPTSIDEQGNIIDNSGIFEEKTQVDTYSEAMHIYLWNDFMDAFGNKWYDMYKK